MIKMMNSEELSEAEAQKMHSFMRSHYQSSWPMMGNNRMYNPTSRPHMFTDTIAEINWLYLLTLFVWLAAGILLLVFLLQRLE